VHFTVMQEENEKYYCYCINNPPPTYVGKTSVVNQQYPQQKGIRIPLITVLYGCKDLTINVVRSLLWDAFTDHNAFPSNHNKHLGL